MAKPKQEAARIVMCFPQGGIVEISGVGSADKGIERAFGCMWAARRRALLDRLIELDKKLVAKEATRANATPLEA